MWQGQKMGVSDGVHFAWIGEVVQRNREKLLAGLPKSATVLGLGENKPSPVAIDLLGSKEIDYRLFDGFPTDPKVERFDLNRLGEINGQADLVFALRCSYFIENKDVFFQNLKPLLRPGAFFLCDFMIGSSRFPVLRFEYKQRKHHAEYAGSSTFFKSSFFDERIPDEHSDEIQRFARHARLWPVDSAWNYVSKYGLQFFDEWSTQLGVNKETFAQHMQDWFPPEQLFSLGDFRRHGFKIVEFSARYFYPQIHKFHFYNFVIAQYEGQ